MQTHTLPGIAASLAGKHIIVIGATGFLGKVLVEALLREAPGVAQVTLLVRAGRPVVTMDSELQVTTGSYFVGQGYITEADGDQPGCLARLHEERGGAESVERAQILASSRSAKSSNSLLGRFLISSKNGAASKRLPVFMMYRPSWTRM